MARIGKWIFRPRFKPCVRMTIAAHSRNSATRLPAMCRRRRYGCTNSAEPSTIRTPRIAYGNIDGLIEEQDVPETLKEGQLFLNKVELTGPGPFWLAFTGASETANRRAKPNGYRALIVRQYEAVIGGKTYANPTFSAPVYKANPTNLDIELLPPAGIREFSKGDRIELDLELITLPRVADDYYGPNESFRKHLAENPNSWKTTYREAKGNDLNLAVSGGRVLQSYPIVIHVEEPEVAVTIQGGIGAVPIRFEGLESSKGYRLYQVTTASEPNSISQSMAMTSGRRIMTQPRRFVCHDFQSSLGWFR